MNIKWWKHKSMHKSKSFTRKKLSWTMMSKAADGKKNMSNWLFFIWGTGKTFYWKHCTEILYIYLQVVSIFIFMLSQHTATFWMIFVQDGVVTSSTSRSSQGQTNQPNLDSFLHIPIPISVLFLFQFQAD